MVWQEYNVQVSGTRTSVSSTAILSCVVPPAVKDYVIVNAWYKDDSMLLPGPSDTGKSKSLLLLMYVNFKCNSIQTTLRQKRPPFGL